MKHLAEIESELASISARRSRVLLVSLGFLLLLFTATLNAHTALRNDATEAAVRELRGISATLGTHPSVPLLLDALYRGSGPPPRSLAPDRAPRELTQAERDSLRHRANTLGDFLAAAQDTAVARLVVQYDLFGVRLPMHLAYWSTLLPFAVIITFAYVLILREKQRCTLELGSAVLRTLSPDDRTPLERVYFSDSPGNESAPPARYPRQLVALTTTAFSAVVVFIIFMLFEPVLLALMVESGAGSPMGQFAFAVLRTYGLFVVFVGAYVIYVTGRFRLHYAVHGAHTLALPRVIPAVHAMVSRIVAVLRRLPGFVLPLAGSTPVLLTLVLFVALRVQACSAEPATGLELLAGERPVYWFTAVDPGILGPEVSRGIHLVGRSFYLLALLFAVAALVYAGALTARIPRRPRGLHPRMTSLALAAYAYAIVDTAIDLDFANLWSLPVRIGCWLIVLYSWLKALRAAAAPLERQCRVFLAVTLLVAVVTAATMRLWVLARTFPDLLVGAACFAVGSVILLCFYSLAMRQELSQQPVVAIQAPKPADSPE